MEQEASPKGSYEEYNEVPSDNHPVRFEPRDDDVV